jgi:hypothetical protein
MITWRTNPKIFSRPKKTAMISVDRAMWLMEASIA